MQELSTIVQYKLPVKIFILNNQWMGMVRQWQELNHGTRYSESYTESLPDLIMLAKRFFAQALLAHEAALFGYFRSVAKFISKGASLSKCV